MATSSRSRSFRKVDLPEPDGTDEEDELALQDLEGEVLQGDDIAFVRLGDVFETNHGKRSIGSGTRVAVDFRLIAEQYRIIPNCAICAIAGTPR